MKKHLFGLFLSILIAGVSFVTRASHIYGMDFSYKHLAGSTYIVTLAVYGDCSGPTFPRLSSSRATVTITKEGNFFRNIELNLQPPFNGTDVTPVCPSQLNQTVCSSPPGPLPGVKKFVYSGTVDLSGKGQWKFLYTGEMLNSQAGRSDNITNIVLPPPQIGGSVITMEALLDNTDGENSSPEYTTIPTPFYAINQQVTYNSGTVDEDNDRLQYELVPGLEETGTVTYIPPFTADSPLSCRQGSFEFDAQTGQLTFVPDMLQKALVVSRVSEYRNGKLVGTSMREMTFVVIDNTIFNRPPVPNIVNHTAGILLTGKTLSVCNENRPDSLQFEIIPGDADTDRIKITYSGIPAGAQLIVEDDSTPTPHITFKWKVKDMAPGFYNFFITFTDNGCPIINRETHAYTVIINGEIPKPALSANSPVCYGDTIKLFGEHSMPNPAFRWSGPDTFYSEDANPIIPDAPYTRSGTYSAYTIINACHSKPETVDVAVISPKLPNATSNSPVHTGETLRLYATHEFPGAKYFWTGPDSFYSEEQNPFIDTATKIHEGSYLVTVVAGCTSTAIVPVTIYKTDFVLYPNPNTGNFSVKGPVDREQEVRMEVLNALGMIVHKDMAITSKQWLQKSVSLNNICAAGLYIFRMRADGRDVNIPFIVAK